MCRLNYYFLSTKASQVCNTTIGHNGGEHDAIMYELEPLII